SRRRAICCPPAAGTGRTHFSAPGGPRRASGPAGTESTMSISSTFKSIQDIMRKDVGVDGDAQRIGQLVWMLFLKILDDREQEWELLGDSYRSPIPHSCRWRTCAANPEGITGEELKLFIDNNLFPQLQNLHEY